MILRFLPRKRRKCQLHCLRKRANSKIFCLMWWKKWQLSTIQSIWECSTTSSEKPSCDFWATCRRWFHNTRKSWSSNLWVKTRVRWESGTANSRSSFLRSAPCCLASSRSSRKRSSICSLSRTFATSAHCSTTSGSPFSSTGSVSSTFLSKNTRFSTSSPTQTQPFPL